jgi:hypothetical protein
MRPGRYGVEVLSIRSPGQDCSVGVAWCVQLGVAAGGEAVHRIMDRPNFDADGRAVGGGSTFERSQQQPAASRQYINSQAVQARPPFTRHSHPPSWRFYGAASAVTTAICSRATALHRCRASISARTATQPTTSTR